MRFLLQPLTAAADVYSMGMIFFSLMAGDLPYDGDQDRLEIALARGSRPDIRPSWHTGFMKVIWVWSPIFRDGRKFN